MSASKKIALNNVKVFDGHGIRPKSTVVIDDDVIGSDPTGAVEIDCHGSILLPGLIDCHVHLYGPQTLKALTKYGVTTALDMGTWPPKLVDSLRKKKGLTDILSAGAPATAPGSKHCAILEFDRPLLVANPDEATEFVAKRVSEGADYIKIVSDVPGLDQKTMNALVSAAHEHKKKVVAHAATSEPFAMAQKAKVDIVTHVPLDKTLDDASIQCMLSEKRVSIPTMTMMDGIAKRVDSKYYAHIRESVAAMHRAGILVLAGTDSNAAPHVPANVIHGRSLHLELELLVDAGLSPVEALRAATILPAEYFGLNDRGAIEPGRRADLVLISQDPVKNINATQEIERVWCGGIEYPLDSGESIQAETAKSAEHADEDKHAQPGILLDEVLEKLA
ncbi:hypothetical protein MMC20_007530 [Loxospora ochrophaea]|nr:hypothetical protein [Loxospora ochrophaea]